MFASNTYLIRLATDDDAVSLARLAQLDGRGPLLGSALIGHINGEPAAAISAADRQIVADPLRRTDHLVACLRVRANALHAYEATPSLRMRMLAGLSVADQPSNVHGVHPPKRKMAAGKKTAKSHRRWRPVRRRVPSVVNGPQFMPAADNAVLERAASGAGGIPGARSRHYVRSKKPASRSRSVAASVACARPADQQTSWCPGGSEVPAWPFGPLLVGRIAAAMFAAHIAAAIA